MIREIVIKVKNLYGLVFGKVFFIVLLNRDRRLQLDCWIDWRRIPLPTKAKHDIARAFRGFADDIENLQT